MVHSPPVMTTLDGETELYEISIFPNVSVCESLLDVENCPLRTASRLTAQPASMFFHSESGNSRQEAELVRERLVDLGSTEYSLSRWRVCLRFEEIMGGELESEMTH